MLSYDIDIGRNLKQKLLKEDIFGKRETYYMEDRTITLGLKRKRVYNITKYHVDISVF